MDGRRGDIAKPMVVTRPEKFTGGGGLRSRWGASRVADLRYPISQVLYKKRDLCGPNRPPEPLSCHTRGTTTRAKHEQPHNARSSRQPSLATMAGGNHAEPRPVEHRKADLVDAPRRSAATADETRRSARTRPKKSNVVQRLEHVDRRGLLPRTARLRTATTRARVS
jgi:hypothetical protein